MKENFSEYKILVVGAGVMGRSIAQVFAAKGLTVYLTDLKEDYLKKAMQENDAAIDILIENGMADESYRDAVHRNIHTMTNDGIPSIGKEVDIAFEVIYEDKGAKREIYKLLSDSCREDCILASNTSGMDIFSVVDDVITHPERLIITHWFNPPHLMKLIEVVCGEKTSEETVAATRGLLEYAGKKPAVLRHFIPGFIVNRIATVINRELYYMVEQGWVTAEDAENAIRYTDGLRFGVEAEYVVEIINNYAITRLPIVPPYVRGIINLRGLIIPILDIRSRLGKAPAEDDCIVVLSQNETQLGILVDTVDRMVDVDRESISPMPAQNTQELISGMCSLAEGETLLILDCEKLFQA